MVIKSGIARNLNCQFFLQVLCINICLILFYTHKYDNQMIPRSSAIFIAEAQKIGDPLLFGKWFKHKLNGSKLGQSRSLKFFNVHIQLHTIMPSIR